MKAVFDYMFRGCVVRTDNFHDMILIWQIYFFYDFEIIFCVSTVIVESIDKYFVAHISYFFVKLSNEKCALGQ